MPSDFRARLWTLPAAMAVMPVRPLTWTGVLRFVVDASPNCPFELVPEAHTVPSDFNCSVCRWPAATAMTLLTLVTCTGVFRCVVVVSPRAPVVLAPQA